MKYSTVYTGMYCWTGYIGAVRGAVTAVVWLGFSALGPTWSRITEEGIPVLAVDMSCMSIVQ